MDLEEYFLSTGIKLNSKEKNIDPIEKIIKNHSYISPFNITECEIHGIFELCKQNDTDGLVKLLDFDRTSFIQQLEEISQNITSFIDIYIKFKRNIDSDSEIPRSWFIDIISFMNGLEFVKIMPAECYFPIAVIDFDSKEVSVAYEANTAEFKDRSISVLLPGCNGGKGAFKSMKGSSKSSFLDECFQLFVKANVAIQYYKKDNQTIPIPNILNIVPGIFSQKKSEDGYVKNLRPKNLKSKFIVEGYIGDQGNGVYKEEYAFTKDYKLLLQNKNLLSTNINVSYRYRISIEIILRIKYKVESKTASEVLDSIDDLLYLSIKNLTLTEASNEKIERVSKLYGPVIASNKSRVKK